MKHPHLTEMRLYSRSGARLYLNKSECNNFADFARHQEPHIAMLCLCLLYTGCRISEAVNLTNGDIQCEEATIAINSLKKRNKASVREVPVPPIFIQMLEALLINTNKHDASNMQHQRLWPVDRTTAWRWVKQVMADAEIVGLQASPKGLRHAFGIRAVQSGIPLNLVQKWLGHAQLSTTAIYANAVGSEEHGIAMLMWGRAR